MNFFIYGRYMGFIFFSAMDQVDSGSFGTQSKVDFILLHYEFISYLKLLFCVL